MEPLFGLSFCVAGGFSTKFSGKTHELVSCANKVYSGFFPSDIKSITEFTAGQKATQVQVRVSQNLLGTLAIASEPSQVALKQLMTRGLNWQSCKTTPAMMLA